MSDFEMTEAFYHFGENDFHHISAIILSNYRPGHALEDSLATCISEGEKAMVRGEYHNLRHEFALSEPFLKEALKDSRDSVRIFTYMLLSTRAIVLCDVEGLRRSREEVSRYLHTTKDNHLFTLIIDSLISNSVYSQSRPSEVLDACLLYDLSDIDRSARLYHLYVYCRYLFASRQFEKMETIINTIFILKSRRQYPLLTAVLHILMAISCSLRSEDALARQSMQEACELLRPDGFYYAMLEFQLYFSSSLTEVLKESWPECHAMLHDSFILQVTNRIHSLNALSGRYVPTTLTRQEMRISILAAHGFSNKEIATQLAISSNTVKAFLNNVFLKCHISKRSELAAVFF